jgi:hypothetical protein
MKSLPLLKRENYAEWDYYERGLRAFSSVKFEEGLRAKRAKPKWINGSLP